MATNMVPRAAAVVICLVVTGSESRAEDSPTIRRQTICLDGTWQVTEGDLDRMPDVFDHTVPVPGLLDMATPEFDTPGSVVSEAERGVPWQRPQRSDPSREAFWYRRTFEVDYPTSTVAMLKVNKAFLGTCVFLNGHKVGIHPWIPTIQRQPRLRLNSGRLSSVR